MFNPFLASFEAQKTLFLAGWRFNQQLVRSYLAFWDCSPENSGKTEKNRSQDWCRHILPYPWGASLTDHYGKRTADVDVDRI